MTNITILKKVMWFSRKSICSSAAIAAKMDASIAPMDLYQNTNEEEKAVNDNRGI